MSNGITILPSGEEVSTTPAEVLKYVDVNALRQIFRQERLRSNLKPNKDIDYFDKTGLYKYTGSLHNETYYQRMEIRTFPDNGANPGFSGINNSNGLFPIVHNIDKWDHAMSNESIESKTNRLQMGSSTRLEDKSGYGLDDNGNMVRDTHNREASIMFDAYDGRNYVYTNDEPVYVNNETRSNKLPLRTMARICDIPTRITDLKNDLDFVSDPDYNHTDNNFNNSNRFLIDNMDDRTFVYPEISKDIDGNYIQNLRVGLNGESVYGESDGANKFNTQPDPYNDRKGDATNSIGTFRNYSGVNNSSGYFPGVFRSLEELKKVNLVGQKRKPLTHNDLPGAKRSHNYYLHDGVWASDWFERDGYNSSYSQPSLNPSNMELILDDREPAPYSQLNQSSTQYKTSDLYQWRYNRISLVYPSSDIQIHIVEPGIDYNVGDMLRWSFGDDVFLYKVNTVGFAGQIQSGEYYPKENRDFFQDPSTHGVGIRFTNMSGLGRDAKLSISSKVNIKTFATQLKNNLYAYVNVVPNVRSDNISPWSDINMPDDQGGKVAIRSTSGFPAYSGINSGRGGPAPDPNSSSSVFYEHGGNATAGAHVHLFRYVINTQNPLWITEEGFRVYTGEWIDQGPLGLERAVDLKSLIYSVTDCNNFNNYYKFSLDTILDSKNKNPDGVTTGNSNAIASPFIHMAQRDPEFNQRFTDTRVNPESSAVEEIDITDKVLYINGATGVMFMYNSSHKNDPKYGLGSRAPGWIPLAGAISR